MLSVAKAELPSEGATPRVTIVIPVYNGASFLNEAIDSALGQTYANIEVIVVNDGSDDDNATHALALSFGARIRYFSKDNGGVASALNLAIRNMTGEYFSWLSHDDLYCAEKVAQQMAFLNGRDADRTVVYSDYSIFTDAHNTPAVPVCMSGVPAEHFRYWLTTHSALHGCSLLIPRSVFETVGYFDENLRTTQDYDLWFRAAGVYAFVHLPSVLVHARHHNGQGTSTQSQLAFDEAAALHLGFVKALVPAELPGAAGTGYLLLTSRLGSRGFYEASRHCAQLARGYGVSNVRVGTALFNARCLFVVRGWALRWLPSQARQTVRRVFTRLRNIRRGLNSF